MNGRVYDYNLGRFMSVDPVIQSPTNSQSINPYSYIMNNPLSGTDPTGYVAKGVGTNASNWSTDGCDLEPAGCTSTPTDRALGQYSGGGNGGGMPSGNAAKSVAEFNKNGRIFTKLKKMDLQNSGTVKIIDLPSTNENQTPSGDVKKPDEPPKDHNITIVAHLDDEDDWIGHAFVIMRNAKGKEIAKGYWPKDSADAKDFIMGTDIDGSVYDEKGDYYERFNEWQKTGKDPGKPNGQFAYKSFAITRQQYGDAMKAMKGWSANPYSSSRMCGTFATHVLSASGNKVWDRWVDPHPTRLFEQFGGKF